MGGSKSSASVALFLAVNILFFAFASACNSCPNPNPRPRPNPNPNPSNGGNGSNGGTGSNGGNGSNGGSGSNGGNGSNGGTAACPRDALKLGVCANVLNGLLNISLGQPPVTPCCSLIQGLADLEAAVCLCTALRANILGINLNLPISLSLLLNVCSRNVPRGFQCN